MRFLHALTQNAKQVIFAVLSQSINIQHSFQQPIEITTHACVTFATSMRVGAGEKAQLVAGM